MKQSELNELREIHSVIGKAASVSRNHTLIAIWKRLRKLIDSASVDAPDPATTATIAPAKRGLSALRRLAQETT